MPEKTILIIDDDDELRELYKNTLKNAGLHVLTASNGTDGWDRAKTFNPDLVLLDLVMPQKSGFDVLRNIRSEKSMEKTKVIVLTSLGNESDVEYATSIGANGYLVKSNISLNDLAEQMRKELES